MLYTDICSYIHNWFSSFSVQNSMALLFHYYVFVCIWPGKAVPKMTYLGILCRVGR